MEKEPVGLSFYGAPKKKTGLSAGGTCLSPTVAEVVAGRFGAVWRVCAVLLARNGGWWWCHGGGLVL